MDSAPSSLAPYDISLVLHYISPPSQLPAVPIPPHLLSSSLLRRHHFLQISPADTADYLCWPSQTRDRAISLLESLHSSADDASADCHVQYTSDAEHTYAHVHVLPTGTDGLRLVFQWDGRSSWRYHDANLMPFPNPAYPALGDALSAAIHPNIPNSTNHASEDGEYSDGDDADYWNSYGADDDASPRLNLPHSKDGSEVGEDVYWARYTSVQGTADSTIPSPVQKTKRKLHPEPQPVPTEEPLPVRPRIPYSNDALPSPNTLSRRLTALSPRHSRPPSSFGSRPESVSLETSATSELESQEKVTFEEYNTDREDSETPSPIQDASADATSHVGSSLHSPNMSRQDASIPSRTNHGMLFMNPNGVHDSNAGLQAEDIDDEGVRSAILGVYRLWKASRRGHWNHAGDGAEFMSIVGDVVGHF